MGFPDTLGNLGIVEISDTAPTIGMNGLLWFDPTTGELAISVEGEWVTVSGSGGSTQVYVGEDEPEGDELIWIDTTTEETRVHYRVGEVWVDEVIDAGDF